MSKSAYRSPLKGVALLVSALSFVRSVASIGGVRLRDDLGLSVFLSREFSPARV